MAPLKELFYCNRCFYLSQYDTLRQAQELADMFAHTESYCSEMSLPAAQPLVRFCSLSNGYAVFK
jgi:hypothetical protein